MTRRRFKLARHFRDTRPWDFLMLVEMGTDRLHHAFWRFYDHKHPDYEPGNPYEQAFRDYYKMVDAEIGELIEGLGDDTAVLVVSDHGAQSMFGGIQINEWLMQNGYLTLVDPPTESTPIGRCEIDWVEHAGVGRRRLLLAHLPQHRRARAAAASFSPTRSSRCSTS